jgi:hypothetical protein
MAGLFGEQALHSIENAKNLYPNWYISTQVHGSGVHGRRAMKIESRPDSRERYYGYGEKRKATNREPDKLNSNPNC